MRRFAIREWATDEGIEMRIGINTGEALVTVDARPEAGETMAAGDVVNTAARLQSAAPVNGILVGEQAYRATERAIEYSEAEPVDAKGKAEPVQALGGRTGTCPGRGRPRPRRRARRSDPRGRAARGRARAHAGRALAAARHARRCARDRQEPARPRAVRRDRAPPGPDLLAARPLSAVRRGRHLLGARRDGQGAGRNPRGRRRGRGGPKALATPSPTPGSSRTFGRSSGLPRGAEPAGDARDEAFTAWRRFFEGLADERPLVLVFEDSALGRRPSARLRRPPRRVVDPASRCSSSVPRGPSCSPGGPAGEAGSRTR